MKSIVSSYSNMDSLQSSTKPAISSAIPIISSHDHHIRPLLDAIDELRKLDVAKEGIALPTIVVVGDQSHGKSSVLESLAGVSLPRGQSLCTRVPLIMRMLRHADPNPYFHLEYLNKIIPTSEDRIPLAIEEATRAIAGEGNGVSGVPLMLLVKKQGVPDLTMVDLPGIVRVPVEGQPKDICDQIQNIIREYITPDESIILNVLPATSDFATCGSIAMSQSVDPEGERTLAVVTKSDIARIGLYGKVTTNVVNIKLGYICVRNRVREESFEEARKEEQHLFRSDPHLRCIDKSAVGIPALAEKLMELQAISIKKCFPEFVKKIDEALNRNLSEIKNIPPCLTSPADTMAAFVEILGECKEGLRNILLRGEFDAFRDDESMYCNARLAEMFLCSYDRMKLKHPNADISSTKFLMEEIVILQELKGLELPNFLPCSAFLVLLKKKMEEITHIPTELVEKVWLQIEEVVVRVLSHRSENYPQLQSAMTMAVKSLIMQMKEDSHNHVKEMVDMEMLMGYTLNPWYLERWGKLMEHQNRFLQAVVNRNNPSLVELPSLGRVDVAHLRDSYATIAGDAFDLRMRITAYWDVVILRFVDNLAFHFRYYMEKLVTKEFQKAVMNELMDDKLKRIQEMLKEPRGRTALETRIAKLKKFKLIIGKATNQSN